MCPRSLQGIQMPPSHIYIYVVFICFRIFIGMGQPPGGCWRGTFAWARHVWAWNVLARRGTARFGTARFEPAQHGTFWYGTARNMRGTARLWMERHVPAWHSTARHGSTLPLGTNTSTSVLNRVSREGSGLAQSLHCCYCCLRHLLVLPQLWIVLALMQLKES